MKLYKFRSLENIERTAEIIIDEKLFCSDYDQLNDPFEGQFLQIIRGFSSAFSKITFAQSEEKLQEILGSFKICSLSEKSDDVRMWSFYANDHKGIAIEIDFTGFENDIKEVVYQPELSKYNLTTPDLVEILTKKTKHWVYESEHRVIQEEKYYPIKGRINKIYLGQRISVLHLEILKKIIPTAIPIYKTKLDPDEIKIVCGDLVER